MISRTPFSATFVSRGKPRQGQSDSTVLVERDRYVGDGMREDIVLRNLGHEAMTCSLAFELDADFAHLFDVKESRVQLRGHHSVQVTSSEMVFSYEDRDITRRLDVAFPKDADVTARSAKIHVAVAPGSSGESASSFV